MKKFKPVILVERNIVRSSKFNHVQSFIINIPLILNQREANQYRFVNLTLIDNSWTNRLLSWVCFIFYDTEK